MKNLENLKDLENLPCYICNHIGINVLNLNRYDLKNYISWVLCSNCSNETERYIKNRYETIRFNRKYLKDRGLKVDEGKATEINRSDFDHKRTTNGKLEKEYKNRINDLESEIENITNA